MSTSILPQETPSIQTTYSTIGAIRYRIRFLRATWGDCLNLWPKVAQVEYRTLAKRKQEMENK